MGILRFALLVFIVALGSAGAAWSKPPRLKAAEGFIDFREKVAEHCYKCCGGIHPDDGTCSSWCNTKCPPPNPQAAPIGNVKECGKKNRVLRCSFEATGVSANCNTLCRSGRK